MIALFLDMENDEVRIVTVNGLKNYCRLIAPMSRFSTK